MPRENKSCNGINNPVEEQNVDKGFSWVILAGSFSIFMLVLGTLKSYGVLYTEMVDYYASGSGNTAWSGSIAWVLMLTLGPVANILCKRFSFQKVTMVGGVLVGAGYFMSGFVQKMEMMYLTFAVVGIGYGLTGLPCATIVSFYFKKRRALANGIVVSSSGIGLIAFPFLYKFLIELYGLPGTFWILGAITLNICVAGAVYRQPLLLKKDKKRKQIPGGRNLNTCDCSDTDREENESDEKKKQEGCCCSEIDFKFRLLKYPLFTMYIVVFTIIAFGHVNNSIIIPSQIKALGYDKTFVAAGVSISGGVEIIARILFGWFTDLKIVQTKYLLVISVFIGAFFAFIAPLFKSFTYMAIYAVVVSAFPASYLSLIPILVIETVGIENLPAGYGLVSFGMAAACAFNQPVSGWMEDYFGNWHAAFILTGSTFVLAGVIVLFEPLIARCDKTLQVSVNTLSNDDLSLSDKSKQRGEPKKQIVSSVCQDPKTDGKTNLAFMNENAIATYSYLLDREENDIEYTSLRIDTARL